MATSRIRFNDLQDQLLAAKSANGSRLLSAIEAKALLDHCVRCGWMFESIEVLEVSDSSERLDLGFSMLGLTPEERSGEWDETIHPFIQLRLDKARESAREIRFKVWVDTGISS